MISYYLRMTVGPTPGKIISLPKADLGIGRELANDIVIPDADVSRRHARLLRLGDEYWLEDLDSTNGTFVNGQQLERPQTLQPGDQIRLGENVVLLFEAATPDLPPTGKAPLEQVQPVGEFIKAIPPAPPVENPPIPLSSSAPQEPPVNLASSVIRGLGRGAEVAAPLAGAPAPVAPLPVPPAANKPVANAPAAPRPVTHPPTVIPPASDVAQIPEYYPSPTPAVEERKRIMNLATLAFGAILILISVCGALGVLVYSLLS